MSKSIQLLIYLISWQSDKVTVSKHSLIGLRCIAARKVILSSVPSPLTSWVVSMMSPRLLFVYQEKQTKRNFSWKENDHSGKKYKWPFMHIEKLFKQWLRFQSNELDFDQGGSRINIKGPEPELSLKLAIISREEKLLTKGVLYHALR